MPIAMRRLWSTWLLAGTIAFTAPAPLLYAQSGTIVGTVNDPVGAVLPGASVTATNIETDLERRFITDDHGDFTLPLLPIGIYRIEAALPGFRTAVAENIFLSVDDRLRFDLTRQCGEVAERLTIRVTTSCA